MHINGPAQHVSVACEQILRSLPQWFGIEAALREYVEATERLPTFIAVVDEIIVGFVTLESHFSTEWEIHCIAVHEKFRSRGIGSALISSAEHWLRRNGVRSLLVKTIAESHPSPEYKESRAFYQSKGFAPDKIIPDIWGASNPCLQMRKEI
jgi:ribosomal protein S18 acetylase RimI-like enzyme